MQKKWMIGSALGTYGAGRAIFKHLKYKKNKAALPGQVIVLTGASSGIGKAYAYALAEKGCQLVLAARRAEKLEEIATDLREKYAVSVFVCPTDVSVPEQAQHLIESAQEHFGRIDILINNAGISTFSYFYKDTLDNMRQVMDVNYWGAVYCTHAVLPLMIKQKSGRVVNIASTAAKIAPPGLGNYAATKHALKGHSDSLRVEVAKYGIKVQTICPTSTQTDIVKVSNNTSGINFNPDNYFGMSVERVAKETVHAIYNDTPEYLLGAGEKIGVQLKHFCPGFLDLVFRTFGRLAFKD